MRMFVFARTRTRPFLELSSMMRADWLFLRTRSPEKEGRGFSLKGKKGSSFYLLGRLRNQLKAQLNKEEFHI